MLQGDRGEDPWTGGPEQQQGWRTPEPAPWRAVEPWTPGAPPGEGGSPHEEQRLFNWFSPDPQARRGRVLFDSSRGMHWVAGGVMMAVLALMALNFILVGIDFIVGLGLAEGVQMDAGAVILNGIFLILGLAVPALLWVASFYEGGAKAWAHGLFLRLHRPFLHVAVGLGGAVAMLVIALLVTLLMTLVGADTDNPVVEDMAAFLTWPLVFWLAFSAAVGEELFFRGFLQPRIGIVASAVLFGLLHMSYGVPIQVLMPLLFGFLLSGLVVVTRSLLPAIVAHFGYNFGVGAFLIIARDLGELEPGLLVGLF